MTMRMYARRKGYPLNNVRVRLRHDKIHAQDCADCENSKSMIDRIDKSLELIGPLDETQRTRLVQIADHCPIHRTLTSKIDIWTTLEPAG